MLKNFVAPFAMCFRIGCFSWRLIIQWPVFNMPLHISLILGSLDKLDMITSFGRLFNLVMWGVPLTFTDVESSKGTKWDNVKFAKDKFFYIAPPSNERNS